jgi:hypothetical protein
MKLIEIPTNYYQHFDADFDLDIPGEGYGGWKKANLTFDLDHTAIVVIHVWDCGTREEFPGWHRAVEYIPRADAICENALPDFLQIARGCDIPIIHVVAHSGYFENLPGYQKVLSWAGEEPPAPEMISQDSTLQELRAFRSAHTFQGTHNQKDIQAGFARLDFPAKLKPRDDELIAATSHQLFVACKELQINHLIYTGFAINGCLWTSPGGMIDMARHGVLCSTIRQLTTAIENKESARHEANKENALWATALLYGFVFDVDEISVALKSLSG